MVHVRECLSQLSCAAGSHSEAFCTAAVLTSCWAQQETESRVYTNLWHWSELWSDGCDVLFGALTAAVGLITWLTCMFTNSTTCINGCIHDTACLLRLLLLMHLYNVFKDFLRHSSATLAAPHKSAKQSKNDSIHQS